MQALSRLLFNVRGLWLLLALSALLTPVPSAAAATHADRTSTPTRVGRITEYWLHGFSEPWAITTGPDDNLWFTELYNGDYHFGNKIGRITTQ